MVEVYAAHEADPAIDHHEFAMIAIVRTGGPAVRERDRIELGHHRAGPRQPVEKAPRRCHGAERIVNDRDRDPVPQAIDQYVAQCHAAAPDIVECVELEIYAVLRVPHRVEHRRECLCAVTQQINSIAIDGWRVIDGPLDLALYLEIVGRRRTGGTQDDLMLRRAGGEEQAQDAQTPPDQTHADRSGATNAC